MQNINDRLLTNLHSIFESKQRVDTKDNSIMKTVNKVIQSVTNEALEETKSYLSSHPVTQEDVVALQLFRDILNQVDKIVSVIGLSTFNDLVDTIILGKTEVAYFQTNASRTEKIMFLLDKFKDIFVSLIADKINKQIFFTWNQKLRYQTALKSVDRINKNIECLQKELLQKPNNEKLQSKLKTCEAQGLVG